MLLAALYGAYWYMIRCEGEWEGKPLEGQMQVELEAIENALRADVEFMSVTLGERNPEHYDALVRCADWVKERWESQGYVVKTTRHQAIVFPDEATPERPATMFLPGDQPKITCATCHDPHALTYPETEDTKVFSKQLRAWGEVDIPAGVTIDAGVSATCVNCHANKRDAQYKADFLAGKKTQ